MRLRRAVLVLILSLGFVGACGGGDDDKSAEPAASSDSDSNGSAAGAFTASRCAQEARRLAEASAAATQGAAAGNFSIEDSVDALKTAADSAPSEIKADLRIVADAYAKFASALADANFNPSSGQAPSADAMHKLEEASKAVDTDEVRAASERVSKWFEEKCGK